MGPRNPAGAKGDEGPPRKARPAMKEVAERAGVAVSSVSRVLSGHPDVSSVMQNRVLDAVVALNYQQNLLAQSVRTGETRTVGFVVPDISNQLFAEVASGAEQELQAAGYSMFLMNSMNQSQLELEHLRFMNRRRVDGLLISLADESASAVTAEIMQMAVPYVLVDRSLSGAPRSQMVWNDHQSGVTEALPHLYGLGHPSVALINGNPKVRPSRERAKAFRSFFRRDESLNGQVISGEFSANFGEEATSLLLDSPEPPSALIAGSNQILVGVFGELRRRGLEIARDISVVGCDDTPMAAVFSPPIDTIARSPLDLGKSGARKLLAILTRETPEAESLPTYFTVRGSSGKFPN